MRIKTLGAVACAALASVAVAAAPAASAATSFDTNYNAKLSVSRKADKSLVASITNSSDKALSCAVVVGDRKLIEAYTDIVPKHAPATVGDDLSNEEATRLTMAFLSSKVSAMGLISVAATSTATTDTLPSYLATTVDDETTTPEAVALCAEGTDYSEAPDIFLSTVKGSSPLGSLGSVDVGGSLGTLAGSLGS